MLRLDFTYDDLGLVQMAEKTRRTSVSGVQEKVQLKRVRGGYEIVASGGDAILKPVPRNTAAKLAADIPANEHLTMRIATKILDSTHLRISSSWADASESLRQRCVR